MNGVTRMPHIGFGLSHGVTFAGDSGHDGDSRAVKAQVRKANPAKKLMPFFRGVFWKIQKLVSLLSLRSPYERDNVSVKRGCVDTIAFCGKGDCAALQVDVAQRHRGFRDTATLSHRYKPGVMHPWVLFPQCGFNLSLFVGSDFWLLFWLHSFVPELQTGIGVDVVASNCFLEDGRQNFQLSERSIECSRPDDVAGRIGSELRICPADLVRYLKWRDHVDVLEICSNGGPGVGVSCQRLGIRILISKESWHPNVEAIALSVSIDVKFAHRVLCGYLFDLSKRAVVFDSDFGTLVCPGAVWALISNPVKRACVSFVIRCHRVQHSAAKPNSSMTVSRAK